MRKLVRILSLLIAIAWWPTVSHCLMEDAGWIGSDPCCSEHSDDSHDPQPAHDECTGCFFESSAMIAVKPWPKVPAFQLDPRTIDCRMVADRLTSAVPADFALLEFRSGGALQHLALPRLCPIRGPSFRS